jgi:VIT1/CCC1 family predicted Fe2+/Mn2+ transporter
LGWRGAGNAGGVEASKEIEMRALLTTLAVFAVVLILLGLFLKAVKWLLIIGLLALAATFVLGATKGWRSGAR